MFSATLPDTVGFGGSSTVWLARDSVERYVQDRGADPII